MNNIKESPLQRSANSGYAVRAEYRPLPNCPTLRFGQLRIAATRCVKFPPIKKPAIRGGLRKAGMKQDVQEKPHLDRFIKTAVKIKEAGYGRQM